MMKSFDKNKKNNNSSSPQLSGLKPVLELLATEPEKIDAIFIKKGMQNTETEKMLDLCRETKIRFSLVDVQTLDRMCATGHQGVVARLIEHKSIEIDALLQSVENADKNEIPLLLALDEVQDPVNAGVLARTMYALGGLGLILPRHNTAYLGDAARRAAAGALERLPVAKVVNLARALDEAKEHDITIYGAAAMKNEGSEKNNRTLLNAFTATFTTPAILVLGNEDKGLRPGVLKRCDYQLYIPMSGKFDSLNVAQAGAIILGLMARQCTKK